MQIVRKDESPLLSKIEITLEPSDYAGQYENNLKKYKNKAQIKGFRKGMIPLNTLKKMYGKSLLVDTVYDILNDKFQNYLEENNVNTFGTPIPSTDQDQNLDFDIYHYKSFTFRFDVGIIPDYIIAGVSESDVYDFDEVVVDEKTIQENIEDFRKRNGQQQEVDGPIELQDILEIHAEELNDDETMKENGWKTEFSILVDAVKDESVKTKLSGQSNGFTFTFDISKLEKEDQAYIDKYLLNRTEADAEAEIGHLFKGIVQKIKRQVPADLTEAFFESLQDEKVKNENDLKEVISQEIKNSFEKSARNLLERKIFDKMRQESTLEISKDFYRRLVAVNNKNTDIEVTEENIDKDIESIKWSIIKDDLLKKHNVSVNEGEIKNHFFNQIMGYLRYYPNMDYQFIFDFVEKQMKNKNAVDKASDEIKVGKLFTILTDIVTKNPVSISSTEFLEKAKSLDSAE